MDKITESLNNLSEKLWGWVEAFIRNLPNLGVALLVLLIAYFVSRFVNKYSQKIVKRYVPQQSITKLIGRALAVFVVLVGIFLALGVLNLDKTLNTLIAGAGVSGLVIGLALQGALANGIAGIILSFRKRVNIGDWVETSGYVGFIEDIKLNNFSIREPDNNIVVIPNKTITDNPMKNYSVTERMRIIIECGVGYESDLEMVEKLTKETIASKFPQNGNKEEVEFFYTAFGGSSIDFICRYWVDCVNGKQKLTAKHQGMLAIKKAFDANDVNIPFPIRTLQFDNQLQMASSNDSQE
ncbi:small conductance mechanosensitive channel [Dokdonia sp. Hel_I_63]|uniref:mechanosensitive ion channel family protein n=1 Tax=unclassified Dokdonia TaxID=2615033 RepID=UPI00020A773D|nr:MULTISPECIES: mechanosensitive ion channel family protein [unclassified Dokdonia]AEE20916.1 MscS Mechanosensitive ion channel [Dokdonia sp. 4H-3-7-5]TVZ22837.1 small conductance mechanosensitive channel [Dokdonia sp. Hel_I_63]